MEELVDKLLAKLKTMKGVTDEESDDAFSFAIETAIHDVVNYCHIEVEEIPLQLENTILLMSMDLLTFALTQLNDETAVKGETKSLSEGDFSITKETSLDVMQAMAKTSSEQFSNNYKRVLNGFRKLKR